MDSLWFSAFCALRDGFIYHILSMGLQNDLLDFSKIPGFYLLQDGYINTRTHAHTRVPNEVATVVLPLVNPTMLAKELPSVAVSAGPLYAPLLSRRSISSHDSSL